jgi:hypothetical protein
MRSPKIYSLSTSSIIVQALLISVMLCFISTNATVSPFSPAVFAAINPAGPAPTTIRSYTFAMENTPLSHMVKKLNHKLFIL